MQKRQSPGSQRLSDQLAATHARASATIQGHQKKTLQPPPVMNGGTSSVYGYANNLMMQAPGNNMTTSQLRPVKNQRKQMLLQQQRISPEPTVVSRPLQQQISLAEKKQLTGKMSDLYKTPQPKANRGVKAKPLVADENGSPVPTAQLISSTSKRVVPTNQQVTLKQPFLRSQFKAPFPQAAVNPLGAASPEFTGGTRGVTDGAYTGPGPSMQTTIDMSNRKYKTTGRSPKNASTHQPLEMDQRDTARQMSESRLAPNARGDSNRGSPVILASPNEYMPGTMAHIASAIEQSQMRKARNQGGRATRNQQLVSQSANTSQFTELNVNFQKRPNEPDAAKKQQQFSTMHDIYGMKHASGQEPQQRYSHQIDGNNKLRGILGQDVLIVNDSYQAQSHKVSKSNLHASEKRDRLNQVLRKADENDVLRLKRSDINFTAQDYGNVVGGDVSNNLRNSRSIPMQKGAPVPERPKPLATEVGRRSSTVIQSTTSPTGKPVAQSTKNGSKVAPKLNLAGNAVSVAASRQLPLSLMDEIDQFEERIHTNRSHGNDKDQDPLIKARRKKIKRERAEEVERSPSEAAHSLGPANRDHSGEMQRSIQAERRHQNATTIQKPLNSLQRIPEVTSPPKRPIMLAALPGESQEAANQRALNAVNSLNKRALEGSGNFLNPLPGEAVPRLGDAPMRTSYQFPAAAQQPVKRQPKGGNIIVHTSSTNNSAANLLAPILAASPPLVQAYAVKSKQGFIPGQKKTNQDSYLVQKNFANIHDLWLAGVADGHGLHGHLVSNFVKVNLPKILMEIVTAHRAQLNGGPAEFPGVKTLKKKDTAPFKSFLPPVDKQKGLQNQAIARGAAGGATPGSTEQTQPTPVPDEAWFAHSNQRTRDNHIREAFREVEFRLDKRSRIDAMFSGTTCVVTLFDNDTIVCANAGDSRAILISDSGPSERHRLYSTQLSRDHKPDLPDEAARILKRGGRIEPSRVTPELLYGTAAFPRGKAQQMQFYGPNRVWLKNKQVPGLAMTRSIGDLVAGSVGVTPEPEIQIFQNMQPADKAIVVASDGIWDRFSNEEVTQVVMSDQFYLRLDADGAANHLVREATSRWQKDQGMVDDITIIIFYLHVPPKVGASNQGNGPQENQQMQTIDRSNIAFQGNSGAQVQQNEESQMSKRNDQAFPTSPPSGTDYVDVSMSSER